MSDIFHMSNRVSEQLYNFFKYKLTKCPGKRAHLQEPKSQGKAIDQIQDTNNGLLEPQFLGWLALGFQVKVTPDQRGIFKGREKAAVALCYDSWFSSSL